MLRMVGVEELIAADDDDYVEKAVRLYGDPALRNDLRDRIASHSAILFEDERPVQGFADFLESVRPR
jgi:protein O-GlcNAc transferase